MEENRRSFYVTCYAVPKRAVAGSLDFLADDKRERKKEAKKDASVRSTDKFLSIRRRKGSPMRRDATGGRGNHARIRWKVPQETRQWTPASPTHLLLVYQTERDACARGRCCIAQSGNEIFNDIFARWISACASNLHLYDV